MKALLGLIPFALFAAANCGSESGGPSSTTGGGETDTTYAGSPPKTCRPTCTTAADCAIEGQTLSDASHFACKANRCEWLGCASATECQSAFQSPKATCAAGPGDTVPSCQASCQTAADCAVAGSSLSDASHFACTGGICVWQGCKSTTECQTALHSNRYACEKLEGAQTPTCVPTCNAAGDCAVPGSTLNDASHYTCKANRCAWKGCRSTAECASALQVDKVVCE